MWSVNTACCVWRNVFFCHRRLFTLEWWRRWHFYNNVNDHAKILMHAGVLDLPLGFHLIYNHLLQVKQLFHLPQVKNLFFFGDISIIFQSFPRSLRAASCANQKCAYNQLDGFSLERVRNYPRLHTLFSQVCYFLQSKQNILLPRLRSDVDLYFLWLQSLSDKSGRSQRYHKIVSKKISNFSFNLNLLFCFGFFFCCCSSRNRMYLPSHTNWAMHYFERRL